MVLTWEVLIFCSPGRENWVGAADIVQCPERAVGVGSVSSVPMS